MDIRRGLELGGELFVHPETKSACLVSHKYPVDFREAMQVIEDLGLQKTGENKEGTLRYTSLHPALTDEQKERMVMQSLDGTPIWILAYQFNITEKEVVEVVGIGALVQELRTLALDAQVTAMNLSEKADYYEQMGDDALKKLEEDGICGGFDCFQSGSV